MTRTTYTPASSLSIVGEKWAKTEGHTVVHPLASKVEAIVQAPQSVNSQQLVFFGCAYVLWEVHSQTVYASPSSISVITC